MGPSIVFKFACSILPETRTTLCINQLSLNIGICVLSTYLARRLSCIKNYLLGFTRSMTKPDELAFIMPTLRVLFESKNT